MLDADAAHTQPTHNDDLPRPPRGRSAATRPAGPPAPTASSPAVQTAASTQGESEAKPERSTRRRAARTGTRRATSQASPSDDTAQNPTSEDEKPKTTQTRTRRTRTAKAQTQEPQGEQTQTHEPSRDSAEAEPAKPARRTRTRTASKAPEQAVDDASEHSAKPTRRTRRRTADSAQVDAQPAESTQENQVEASDTAHSATPRRRRASAKDNVTDIDSVFEALDRSSVRQPRKATKESLANLGIEAEADDSGEIDKAKALASLAASIAHSDGEEPQAEAEETPSPASKKKKKSSKGSKKKKKDAARDDETLEAPVEGENEAVVEADAQTDTPTDSSESDDDEDGSSSRRRRRRGGRRRRKAGSDITSDDVDELSESSQTSSDESEESEDEDQPRHRRRRRRRGSDDHDDSTVRVREPKVNADEISGIEGSTRLEAKKQRRREGRATGRNRTPILTEAEFLSRRESVNRIMLVREREDYTQLAVLEDGVLVEHYVDRASSTSLIGNIYLGKVQNVLPSMEAVFIDIGRGRNAVLYAGEVDWKSFEVEADDRKVEQVFKSGQSVVVQVSKDPVGAKGARLTGHISIPGRYVVYSPGGHLSGISRKLPDNERHRLKQILDSVVDDKASVIVRTAAEGVSEEDLVADVERLKTQWETISKKIKQGGAPVQLSAEPDPTVRIIRDTFTEDFSHLIVAGTGKSSDAWERISGYVGDVAPALMDRVQKWESASGDLFEKYRVDEQIAKGLERKVFLPSGGSLVIDRTEAMTVIDVNTGKFTGSGGNLEETITKNNLEAAEEIVRQLRLRDLGGIIVIDFIDMVLPSNRDLLLRRLVECLGRDRTRHQVSEVTSLGLVQMTRKRIGTGLAEAFTEECDHCGGRGYLRNDEPVSSQAPADGGERRSKSRRRHGDQSKNSKTVKNGSATSDETINASKQAAQKIASASHQLTASRLAPQLEKGKPAKGELESGSNRNLTPDADNKTE